MSHVNHTVWCRVAVCVLLVSASTTGSQDHQAAAALVGTVGLHDGSSTVPRVTVIVAGPSTPHRRAVVTDSEGTFRFAQLADGEYLVRVEKPGYLPASSPQRVRITEGRATTRPHLRMRRAAVISGRVWDQAGRPIPRMPVRLLGTDGSITFEPEQYLSLTDDRGHYRIFGIEPGQYYPYLQPPPTLAHSAGVRPPGYIDAILAAARQGRRKFDPPEGAVESSTSVASVFHPGVNSIAQAIAVSVDYGTDLEGVDITVTEAPVSRISGTVSATGREIQVALYPDSRGGPLGVKRADARVDPQGGFEFRTVPPGRYMIQARTLPTTAFRGQALFGRTSVDVFGEDVETGTLEMAPTRSIVGRVLQAGRALSASELGRVRVSSWEQSELILRSGARTGLSSYFVPPAVPVARDGTFNLPGLALGTHFIEVTGLPPDYFVAGIRHHTRDAAAAGVELGPADVRDLIVMVSSEFGTVRGRVDTQLARRSGEDVFVLLFSAPNPLSLQRPVIRWSAVGEDGSYLIADLPQGGHYVVAVQGMDPERLPSRMALHQLQALASKVEISSRETTLNLPHIIAR